MPQANKPTAETPALTLEQQVEALKQQLANQQEEAAAKDAIIEGQAEQLAAATAQGEGKLTVFTHEKKRYQVLAAKFALGVTGTPINHDQLKGDAALAKKVVEEYPGLVQLLEEPAAKA